LEPEAPPEPSDGDALGRGGEHRAARQRVADALVLQTQAPPDFTFFLADVQTPLGPVRAAVALPAAFPAAPPRLVVVQGLETASLAVRQRLRDAEESAVLAAANASGEQAPSAVLRALEAFAVALA
jgi:hypothetical protein